MPPTTSAPTQAINGVETTRTQQARDQHTGSSLAPFSHHDGYRMEFKADAQAGF